MQEIVAYRATLLQIRRGGTESRLVSLFLLESFLTKLISIWPIKTGKFIGQRAEKRAEKEIKNKSRSWLSRPTVEPIAEPPAHPCG
jgi:hypothetical protein